MVELSVLFSEDAAAVQVIGFFDESCVVVDGFSLSSLLRGERDPIVVVEAIVVG